MRSAELELKTVIAIIIAIFVLAVILLFALSTEGGPLSMILSLLGFMNTTTDYVVITGNI